MSEFSELIGKTLTDVKQQGVDILTFTADSGESWRMLHREDCCERVTIEDVAGDLEDLIGSPIVQAEESTSTENPSDIKKEYQYSFTWTFYRIATAKGLVVIRWYGESNGYYSESVDFEKIETQ